MAPTRRSLLAGSLAALGGCLGVGPGDRAACPPSVDTDERRRLAFAGDAMLGRNVDDEWDGRDPAGVWGGLRERLRAADGLLLNLECCVSDRGEPRPGRTFHFRAGPDWAVPALEAAGTVFASLANNHVLDFGRAAFADTLAHLDDAGIPAAGAGPDRRAAFAPTTFTAGDLDVAVVAVTDRSPSYAARANAPGTAYAPLRVDDTLTRNWVGDALARARETDPDLLVASLHWGPNWEARPSDAQRRFARWLIDRGVDVVHGHSAHVIQGVETYRGRPIVYDAGDIVDDYLVKEGLHNDRSFLFELVVDDGTLKALDLVPVRIADNSVGLAGERAARWLRDRMGSLSAPFGTTVERRGAGLRIPLGEC
ncbi:CapA family protein [Haloarcula litorea]|uniref:CapA family protein n=1 Tax=Haloarcula litorea TaxID=3032579 RepID=UPI0023E8BC9C|nr:CapA family protein [Halomicroarcula sp. GDY20]